MGVVVVTGESYTARVVERRHFFADKKYEVVHDVSLGDVALFLQSQSFFDTGIGRIYVNVFSSLDESEWGQLSSYIKTTTHDVLFEELFPSKKLAGFLKKQGIETVILVEKKAVVENPFRITDAYISGDKKQTLLLYIESLEKKETAEEVHSRILWALKTLVMVKKSVEQKDPDLIVSVNPYIVTKMKRAIAAQKNRDFEYEYMMLVNMYHKVHAGEGLLGYELEQFILSVLS